MKDKNNERKRKPGFTLTPQIICIILVFSCIVTLLAFGVAYKEHIKMTELSEKYNELMVKVNNCEQVIEALVKLSEGSMDYETLLTEATAESPSVTYESTAEYTTASEKQTTTLKSEAEQSDKEETTTKAQSTSGPFFITQNGKKYHIGSCSYLSKSKIPISADKIKSAGYSPCSRCIK